MTALAGGRGKGRLSLEQNYPFCSKKRSVGGRVDSPGELRDSPPLKLRIRTLALVGPPLVASPLTSEAQVPTFHSTASWQAQATSHAGCRSARKQVSSELILQ
jgi:hypothetical protein